VGSIPTTTDNRLSQCRENSEHAVDERRRKQLFASAERRILGDFGAGSGLSVRLCVTAGGANSTGCLPTI
jgi:hypothetical protein